MNPFGDAASTYETDFRRTSCAFSPSIRTMSSSLKLIHDTGNIDDGRNAQLTRNNRTVRQITAGFNDHATGFSRRVPNNRVSRWS